MKDRLRSAGLGSRSVRKVGQEGVIFRNGKSGQADMTARHLHGCELRVSEADWSFARIHAAAIEAHWTAATAQNSCLFNGDVFVVADWAVVDGIMTATVLPTKFAAYLYWRESICDNAETWPPFWEAFATTVVLARDGGILLAKSVAGSLNAGLYVSPGGLLDKRDVIDGCIDIEGAAARELAEETGLAGDCLVRRPGFLLATVAPFLAVASVFEVRTSSDELVGKISEYLAKAEVPELEVPVIVTQLSDLDDLAMAPHARLLSTHFLT